MMTGKGSFAGMINDSFYVRNDECNKEKMMKHACVSGMLESKGFFWALIKSLHYKFICHFFFSFYNHFTQHLISSVIFVTSTDHCASCYDHFIFLLPSIPSSSFFLLWNSYNVTLEHAHAISDSTRNEPFDSLMISASPTNHCTRQWSGFQMLLVHTEKCVCGQVCAVCVRVCVCRQADPELSGSH